MDRTIRASSSMIDKQIGKLWDLYKDKTAELHIQPQIVSVILAVPNLPGNILAMFRPDDKAITIIEEVLISNPEDMENIFLHELAHALDWYLYKASGHGQTFRECCRMLGALPFISTSVGEFHWTFTKLTVSGLAAFIMASDIVGWSLSPVNERRLAASSLSFETAFACGSSMDISPFREFIFADFVQRHICQTNKSRNTIGTIFIPQSR